MQTLSADPNPEEPVTRISDPRIKPMNSYVLAQSAGSILRNSAQIYVKNFTLLFMAVLICNIPHLIVTTLGVIDPLSPWLLAGTFLIGTLGGVPITVIVSDICCGYPPTLAHAFGKLTWRAVCAILLAFATIIVGFVLLIIPGILFAAWLQFVTMVVALEGASPTEAFRRSKELGKGYYLRNLGIILLVSIIIGFPLGLTSFFLGFVLALLHFYPTGTGAIGGLLGVLVTPLIIISGVLLYYDMRVRKEGYDTVKLAEDLDY